MMKTQSTMVIAVTLLLVVFNQAQAKERNNDRPGPPPSFSSLDTNANNEIDFDEFSQQKLPHGDHKTIFSHIDSDNNGVISETEFKDHKPPAKKKD
ncbi:EF-hand domain-containing protein [Colwellia sp. M166]|uniref:EF-hand domain-containing protein n=1 Tax=Colwellia sp. M166 TaxID=2583805 RepID=UPI00211E7D73|nr:EF-hand domain-containing protein [Colwellia sp. M166]|tara:strand:- start:3449 stop:3736 length:288 start_codon:yes stop_codon:yes gene_type:complete